MHGPLDQSHADGNICHLPKVQPKNSITQRKFAPDKDYKMPCHHQCEIKQLNIRLKEIKEDKIATLRQILEVTEELGRDNPHRSDEVARSKRQVQRKLIDATTELMYLSDEIARGCNTCQTN